MSYDAIVIGAGINGLVAANYLQRSGCRVLLLEKKAVPGGACTWGEFESGDYKIRYPRGASVLGFMQDFVFSETGLSKELSVYFPSHPSVVYFGNDHEGCFMHNSPETLASELREKWGETGRVGEFFADLGKVRAFLIQGYRSAAAPDLAEAQKKLGSKLVQRWITGSALDLFADYFTSDRMKIHKSMQVTESGPVDIKGPFSAFNVPLMASGSVGRDGAWGFVRGGLWTLIDTLARLNESLGVRFYGSVSDVHVEVEKLRVHFKTDRPHSEVTSAIFLATAPLTAARLTSDQRMHERVTSQRLVGSSGKVVLFFKKPIQWKMKGINSDFDTAFKFIYAIDSLEMFHGSSKQVRENAVGFSPCSFQLYCEGAAMRKFGWEAEYDYVSVFCKDLALEMSAQDRDFFQTHTESCILDRVVNREDYLGCKVITPGDLRDEFFFPQGNYDHTELCAGQNFSDRNYSINPQSFYQWGTSPSIFYCGAGAYPCGSVAGTTGYMAATQWLKQRGK